MLKVFFIDPEEFEGLRNCGDFDLDVGLAVAVLFHVAAFLLVFDDHDFWSTADHYYFAGHCGAGNIGSTDSGIEAIINEQYLVKGYRVAFLAFLLEFLDRNGFAHHDTVLLATGCNNGKFLTISSSLFCFGRRSLGGGWLGCCSHN